MACSDTCMGSGNGNVVNNGSLKACSSNITSDIVDDGEIENDNYNDKSAAPNASVSNWSSKSYSNTTNTLGGYIQR